MDTANQINSLKQRDSSMISVCMATYNGSKYIKEQIDSILPQLGENDELVISDDGSKDDTCSVISSYKDSRIKLLFNNGKHGFIGNFENALRQCKGDYIFLSDQDDYWKDNKVAVVMEQLKKYALVIHDAEIVDGEGKSMGHTYYSGMHGSSSFLMNLWKTRWLGCCMAFSREVLDYCLPFPNKIEGHDYWIGMMGMLKFKYIFISDVLMCYRRHGGNVSPSGEKSPNSLFYKLFVKRANILIAIVGRLLS